MSNKLSLEFYLYVFVACTCKHANFSKCKVIYLVTCSTYIWTRAKDLLGICKESRLVPTHPCLARGDKAQFRNCGEVWVWRYNNLIISVYLLLKALAKKLARFSKLR